MEKGESKKYKPMANLATRKDNPKNPKVSPHTREHNKDTNQKKTTRTHKKCPPKT